MSKKVQADLDVRIVDAAFALFSERGYADIRLTDIAERAECDLGDLRRHLRDKSDVLILFLRRVDASVLGEDAAFGEDESTRDRLFDLLMRRFDALQPQKPALRSIADHLRGDIPAVLSLAPEASRALTWYLEAAGESADGIAGTVKAKGLALIWLRCLRVWFDDDSADLTKTMAALDKALAQAERGAQWFGRMPRAPRRAGAATDEAADGAGT